MACMTAQIPPIAEIEETFEFLDDWEDRFQYLIDLGRKLPALPDADRIEANKVHGCQATVWLTLDVSRESPSTIQLRATSDAHIVNGLIAIVMALYCGRSAEEAVRVNAEALFARLGLEEHLSPTRRNGLHAMLQRVRKLAAAHARGSDNDG